MSYGPTGNPLRYSPAVKALKVVACEGQSWDGDPALPLQQAPVPPEAERKQRAILLERQRTLCTLCARLPWYLLARTY